MTGTRQAYLFLLGANDHVLPAVGQSGGILNDDDREELAQRGIRLAPSGMEQMGIELQNLYAALAQPTEGLAVSYPTADVSGAELRPAFVVDRLLTLFPELRVEHEGTDKVYRLTARIPALETAGTAPGGPCGGISQMTRSWRAPWRPWSGRLRCSGGSRLQERGTGAVRGADLHVRLPGGAAAELPLRLLYGVRPEGQGPPCGGL